MKLDEIKRIAVQHGIKTGNMKKCDLVKAIQRAEDNEDCFKSGKSRMCGQDNCMWRDDCV